MKQSHLCVLSLAEHKEWRRAYELEKKMVGDEMIGSEADTRLYEVFDKKVPDKGSREVDIDGAKYIVNTKKEGGERWWQAFLSKERPAKRVDYIRHPLTGELMKTEEYRKL